MAEEDPRQYESDRVGSVGEPSVSPSSVREQQDDERSHRAEAYAAECRPQARYPYGADHFDKRETCAVHWSNGREGRNEQQGDERSRRGGECDRRKAIGAVDRGAG